jgi:hypothetical protein
MDTGRALDTMKTDVPQLGFRHPQLAVMVAHHAEIFGKGAAYRCQDGTEAAMPVPE